MVIDLPRLVVETVRDTTRGSDGETVLDKALPVRERWIGAPASNKASTQPPGVVCTQAADCESHAASMAATGSTLGAWPPRVLVVRAATTAAAMRKKQHARSACPKPDVTATGCDA
jgi:hypothetical protein